MKRIQPCIPLDRTWKWNSRALKGLLPWIKALDFLIKILQFTIKRTHGKCQDLIACSKKMKIPIMRETPKATSRGCEMLPRWMSRKLRERFCNQKVKAKSVMCLWSHQLEATATWDWIFRIHHWWQQAKLNPAANHQKVMTTTWDRSRKGWQSSRRSGAYERSAWLTTITSICTEATSCPRSQSCLCNSWFHWVLRPPSARQITKLPDGQPSRKDSKSAPTSASIIFTTEAITHLIPRLRSLSAKTISYRTRKSASLSCTAM